LALILLLNKWLKKMCIEGGGSISRKYRNGCMRREHNFAPWVKILSPKIRSVE
jgi:hypothetical protein